jgi:hypothetical protein
VSAKPPAPELPASGGNRPGFVAIRAPSGHLIGYLDRVRMILEVKPRAGRPVEAIDLKPYLRAPD